MARRLPRRPETAREDDGRAAGGSSSPQGAGTQSEPAEQTTDRQTLVERTAEHQTVAEMRRRQRFIFGGLNGTTAFFGWLVATGFGALLATTLAAAGVVLDFTASAELSESPGGGLEVITDPVSPEVAGQTIGLLGGGLFLVVVVIAFYTGGYVAGRMARFDGARQGFGVWVLELLFAVALAGVGAAFGSRYNILAELNLPRVPIGEGPLTQAGIVTLAAVALGTLIAAVIGGVRGTHFHRKVDRASMGL